MFQQQIRLESLLGLESDDAMKPIDLVDATMECADVLEEISIIEQNLTTYEAAKIIKKAKSAKKKTKVAKTKMKAKDAKAKKAGGKVVKITKAKKAALEGDEAVDGGTGPLPTTSDTNGLTDTDLDADPNAEVEVTEIVEDGTPADEIVGTEGTDFIVMYEDASIIALEAEEAEQKKNLGKKVVELIKKIWQWITSAVAKFFSLFQGDEKYLNSNKAAIEAGLKSDKEISVIKVTSGAPSGMAKAIIADLGTLMNKMKGVDSDGKATQVAQLPEEYTKINGVALFKDSAKEDLTNSIFTNGGKPSEAKLSDCGYTMVDIEYFVKSGKKDLEKVKADWKAFSSSNKIKGDYAASKNLISGVYKCIGLVFSSYSKIHGQTSKVMRSAGSAGGGKNTDDAK